MKVFKLILILVLLFSMNALGGYNQPKTQGEISDWQESFGTASTTSEAIVWDDEENCWSWKLIDPKDPTSTLVQCDKPDTLLEWFKNLTLDEKVEVYELWRDKDNPIDTSLDLTNITIVGGEK